MTITLHWWVVPLLLFFVGGGFIGANRSNPSWYGPDINLIPNIVGLALWACALFFTIGHFS